MRTVVAALVIAILATSTASLAEAGTRPAIRVGTSPTLTVVGTGFVARTFVRIRVDVRSTETVRTAVVRVGNHGGFVVRFARLERCSPREVTATDATGIRVRVPAAWFVRECPPGPPLAPGTAVD